MKLLDSICRQWNCEWQSTLSNIIQRHQQLKCHLPYLCHLSVYRLSLEPFHVTSISNNPGTICVLEAVFTQLPNGYVYFNERSPFSFCILSLAIVFKFYHTHQVHISFPSIRNVFKHTFHVFFNQSMLLVLFFLSTFVRCSLLIRTNKKERKRSNHIEIFHIFPTNPHLHGTDSIRQEQRKKEENLKHAN